MKIKDVIKRCDTLFPNEFSLEEKIMWCDELGSMLINEHMPTYKKVTLKRESDGTYKLPQNITLLDVDRIISADRVFRKKDVRSRGFKYLSSQKGYEYETISLTEDVCGSICVIYADKYKRIRYIDEKVEAIANNNTITLKECMLREQDVVELSTDENVYNGRVIKISQNQELDFVVEFDFVLKESGKCNMRIYRKEITEETVVDLPYDSMYIDFVNAKICFYQRDYDNYNAHMSMFNSRLEALDLYLSKNMPPSPDTKIKNWY